MRTRARAFTLLEIMVAVAILGLSLTVILSAQAGLYAGGAYAQRTSVATGLLRCRMAEIEERLMKLGFPEADEKDDGACCDDDSRPDMKCEWKVERIELPTPDPAAMSSSSPMGTSSPGSTPGGGGPLSALMGMGAMGAGATGAPGGLGALGQMGLGSGTSLDLSSKGDGGVSSIASALKDGTGGGVNALAQLAMSIVYPTLKPMLEASTRKITIKVKWKEGIQNRDVTAIQFVTRPMRGDAITALMNGGADGGLAPVNPINANPLGNSPLNRIPGLGP
ncbi:MAG: type II secretion system protein [Polyangiaceae bacterium]